MNFTLSVIICAIIYQRKPENIICDPQCQRHTIFTFTSRYSEYSRLKGVKNNPLLRSRVSVTNEETQFKKINTRYAVKHVLKACRRWSEIPCCHISPDQEAEAALLMLLKRIFKWQRGVQAMTLILGADCQVISSSVWCVQLLHQRFTG